MCEGTLVAESLLNFLVESMCWRWWQWRDAFPADVLLVVCVGQNTQRAKDRDTDTPIAPSSVPITLSFVAALSRHHICPFL